MDTPSANRFQSRFIELRAPRGPARHGNRATMIAEAVVAPRAELFRLSFRANYDLIRVACCRHAAPGVAVIATDDRGVAATAWLSAKVGEPNAAIVGRHLSADVLLGDDAALSLRHLAVLTYPLRAGRDVRFRLLDLRTSTAFTDERGRRLGALEAEGPAFVACGRYCLFLLPTGEDVFWPDDPDAGWQCIPERVYLDEHAAEPDRWQRPRHYVCPPRAEGTKRITAVRTMLSPVQAKRGLLVEGEEPVGVLELRSSAGCEEMVLGPSAAHGGVLLGRYDRCDTQGLRALGDPRISRVHCLLVLLDGEIYAVDVASQNGLHALVAAGPGAPPIPHRIRLVPLRSGDELALGAGFALLRWRASGPAPTAGPRPPTVVSPLVH